MFSLYSSKNKACLVVSTFAAWKNIFWQRRPLMIFWWHIFDAFSSSFVKQVAKSQRKCHNFFSYKIFYWMLPFLGKIGECFSFEENGLLSELLGGLRISFERFSESSVRSSESDVGNIRQVFPTSNSTPFNFFNCSNQFSGER